VLLLTGHRGPYRRPRATVEVYFLNEQSAPSLIKRTARKAGITASAIKLASAADTIVDDENLIVMERIVAERQQPRKSIINGPLSLKVAAIVAKRENNTNAVDNGNGGNVRDGTSRLPEMTERTKTTKNDDDDDDVTEIVAPSTENAADSLVTQYLVKFQGLPIDSDNWFTAEELSFTNLVDQWISRFTKLLQQQQARKRTLAQASSESAAAIKRQTAAATAAAASNSKYSQRPKKKMKKFDL
jgi:hypothetical protein